MADGSAGTPSTPPAPVTTISTVKADIASLEALWSKATSQYEARKAGYAKVIDDYVAQHQTAADAHTAEIDAANVIKAALVPAAAAVVTAGSDIEQFVLTTSWGKKVAAFVTKNKRWFLYGGCLIGMIGIYVWVR